jgi:lipid A 3-O-deacylase
MDPPVLQFRRLALAVLAALAALAVSPAPAQDLRPAGLFAQAGAAGHGSYSLTAGLVWPWSWRRAAVGGELTGLTEAYLSEWSASGTAGRHNFTQLGVVPLVRLRFDEGRSPWFAEAGIGLSWMDRRFTTSRKQFSTQFNFVDVASVGLSLDPARRHELSLRLTHVSNAGIREPNPGETFLGLRYAMTF